MPNLNPNCGGAHCRASTGPVRLRPTGGGGNDILCKDCWAHENRYNAERVADGYEAKNFPQLDWDKAKPAFDEEGN